MSEDLKNFSNLIQSLKTEWQAGQSDLQFSEGAKRSLFLKLREIESENNEHVSWDLLANYIPRFSFASATVAMCFIVTFQLSGQDINNLSFNERVESEGSELIAGSEKDEDFDPMDLIVNEQQGEEV